MQFRTDDFSRRYIVHNENTSGGLASKSLTSGGDLTVYVLPISGGRFVSQLAFLCELHDAKAHRVRSTAGCVILEPDLVFSTSGGNICAYTAMAGNWTTGGIMRNVGYLTPSMFCRSWYPSPLSCIPSWTQGLPMYRNGSGTVEVFRRIFGGHTIMRSEIWSGTYDENRAKSQFFCNRFQQDSLIDADKFSETAFLYGVLPLKWCNGNSDMLANVSVASASIPMVVPGQDIDGTVYSDGGLTYSSPLIPFTHELIRLIRDGNRRLRLYYFASYHLESPHHMSGHGLVKTMLSQFVHLNTLEDRCAAVNLLYRLVSPGSVRHYSHHHMNTVALAHLLDLLDSKRHYVLIMYPHPHNDGSVINVPIRTFKPCDAREKIAYVRNHYGVHAWYC